MEHSRRGGVGHGRQAERVEDRAQAENRRGPITIRHRPGQRLRRAPQQHLDRERECEYVAAPAMCARHRSEKETQPRTRPETDQRDQATAGQDDGGGPPGNRTTDNRGQRRDAVRLDAVTALHRALLHLPGGCLYLARPQHQFEQQSPMAAVCELV
jgi:hypothetical protein